MVAAALALGLLAAGTTATRSDWSAGALAGTGTARSGSLAFDHAYQATSCALGPRTSGDVACAGSIAPTTSPTPGGVSATDAISHDGTLGQDHLQAEVRAASCGPVQLANSATAADPLLPRHGTTFHPGGAGGPMDGAGYVTLGGGSPGGYAASVVAAAQPGGGLLSAGTLSGVGIWFRAAPGASGPLFGFSSSPSDGAGSADRALVLDAAGRLRLVWNLSGSDIGPTSTTYDDGAWHFAHVTFGGVNVVLLGLIPQVRLWVDGVERASTPLLSLAPMSSYSGYWHLGWAPTAVTGQGAYLSAGTSLSGFVVDNTGAIPSGAAIGKPTTRAAFDAAIGTVTHHWRLDDPGTATFGGALPGTMADPCSRVDVAWSFTSPAATATTPTPLSGFADGVWRPVAAPPPGGTQTSTITTTRGTGWNADVAGLRLHAPLSHRVRSAPSAAWSQTFSWSGAEAAFIG